MPRFLLRNVSSVEASKLDTGVRNFASMVEGEETLVVDERCRQSRSSIVEEKFSQLVSLAAARYSSYSVADTN